jgi:branched-chain amino acid aminotransferase
VEQIDDDGDGTRRALPLGERLAGVLHRDRHLDDAQLIIGGALRGRARDAARDLGGVRHAVLANAHARDGARAERTKAVVHVGEVEARRGPLERAGAREQRTARSRYVGAAREAIAERDVGPRDDGIREREHVTAAVLAVGVHGDERLERPFLGLPARLERQAARGLERSTLTEVHGMPRDDDAQSLRRGAHGGLVDGRHAAVVDEEHARARLARLARHGSRRDGRGEILEGAREAAFLVERGHEHGDAHGATLPYFQGDRGPFLPSGADACAPREALPWCLALSVASYSAVYFDGRFVPPHGEEGGGGSPCVPVTDPGYLLGEGVFATMHGYDGVCFRAERHLKTLVRGAALFGMTLPSGIDRIIAIADEAASRTRGRDAYVRVTLTRSSDDERPMLTVLSRPLDVPSADDYARGIPSSIVTSRRIPPACIDGTIKMTSYAPQVLARREAAARGIGPGEGIVLAVDGSLACGTMANLFLVKGNTLLTPALASGCRAGVTRELVLELAARVGLTAREEVLEQSALFDADEAFFTSSRVECLPIASVDGRAIGGADHPHSTALRAALRAVVTDETTLATMSERRGIA